MASTKGQARGGNGDRTTSAENGNGEGLTPLKEGKRSVTELSRLFNQRREGVALVPKTPQETKRSSAVVDWMTKGNAASPAKKPAALANPRPAIPADPLLVGRLFKIKVLGLQELGRSKHQNACGTFAFNLSGCGVGSTSQWLNTAPFLKLLFLVSASSN